MKLAAASPLIAAYEKLAQGSRAAVAGRKELEVKLGKGPLGALIDAFPTTEAFAAFAATMPKTPALDAVVKAFPDPKEMTAFIDGALKGNAKIFSVLAERGCGRDPAVLKALADAFKADPKPMQDMLAEGGLGDHPEAMAAMLEGGCDADPAKLKALFAKFGTPDERKKLAISLAAGGLGQAPGALGALVKHDDGALLKKVTTSLEATPEVLRGVLTEAGCDGKEPNRPGLLAEIIAIGLDGDPARLKDLHDAFKGGGIDALPELGRMLAGLDGDDAQAGERLKMLHDAVKARTALPDADVAKKMRDPYMTSIGKFAMSGKMPRVGGAAAATANATAAAGRAPPPKAQQAAILEAGISDDALASLLSLGLPGAGGALVASAAALGDRADSLANANAEGAPEQTALTRAATTLATDAAVAMSKRVDGASAAEIDALAKLGAAALDAAAVEPDAHTRSAALAAAKAAGKAATDALKRLAATSLAGAPGSAAAAAAQEALARLPGAAPASVKAASQQMATVGLKAAAVSGAATANAQNTADAAKIAIETRYDVAQRAAPSQAAKEAATLATEAAKSVRLQVEKAPRPVDPMLLERAADAAAAAVAAGQASPDALATKAAFDEALAAGAAIAAAVKDAAARFAIGRAQDVPAGATALAAAGDADFAAELLSRLPPSPAAAQVRQAGLAARAAALTGADAVTLEAAGKPGLAAAANAAAYRNAAAAAGGVPGDVAVGQAVTTANAAAVLATTAATTATTTLNVAVVATDPALYAGLIEDAARRAEAALVAARDTVHEATRDAAIAAAKLGAAEAAAGARKLATHHRNAAQAALRVEQSGKITATAGPRDAIALAAPGAIAAARPLLQAAFDNGKAAIADAAAADLSQLAATDADVRLANDAAAAKQAQASLPGADHAAELEAVIAARDAAKVLSTKATARLTGLGAALAIVAVPPADAGARIGEAMTASKSANTAAIAWCAAAKNAEKLGARLAAALTAIDKPTVQEAAALVTVSSLFNATAAETAAANAALEAIAAEVKVVRDAAVRWTTWANTNPLGMPMQAGLQNATGFVISALEDSKVAAQTDADLIRVGPSLKKQHYGGPAKVNATVNGDAATIDMDHITERHVRATYKFEPKSVPLGSDHDAGMLLAGKKAGLSKTPLERNLIAQGALNKPNSFFPEHVDAAAARDIAEEAMVLAAGKAPISPQRLPAFLFNQVALAPANGDWERVFQEVTPLDVGGPPTLSVTIGIAIDADPLAGPDAIPMARMFYPNEGDKLSTPDILVLAKALGVAR